MQVRYMKEVTPYFHKAMLLGDFGWEPPPIAFLAHVSSSNPNVNSNVPVAPSTSSSSSSMIPPEFTSPNSEMKWTSLQLTCLTKDANFPEENASTLEIHSPNRKNSILLRVSTKSVDRWSSAISTAIDQVRYLSYTTPPPHVEKSTNFCFKIGSNYILISLFRQCPNVQLQLHPCYHLEFGKWGGPCNFWKNRLPTHPKQALIPACLTTLRHN